MAITAFPRISKVLDFIGSSSGGGGVLTLNNGLTLTGTNGQLGGTLIKDTIIDQSSFKLSFSGGPLTFGTTVVFTDTDHSFKGSGNDETTYNFQFHNSTLNEWITRIKNSGVLQVKTNSVLATDNILELYDSTSSLLFEFRNNSNIKTAGGFLNASDNTVCSFYSSNLYRENSGPKVVLDWANTIAKDWDALDSINWHYRYLAVDVTEKLNWNSNYLDGGSWRVNTGNNFGLGSSPSYGGGVGVMYIANGTVPSSNPTNGILLYSNTAIFEGRLASGTIDSILANDVQKTTTYTALVTDRTIECTSGTFTVTLYTAVGHNRTLVIKNSGAGTITVDGAGTETIDGALTQSLASLQSLTIRSNGTNWIII